jgi:tetratricopeptide (TPR) repeat protein
MSDVDYNKLLMDDGRLNIEKLRNKGIELFNNEQYDKADEVFYIGYSFCNKYFSLYLALTNTQLNNYKNAIQYYLKFIDLNNEKNYNEIYDNIGQLYYKLNDYKNAIKYMEKAIELNYFPAFNSLGIIYYELKNYDMSKKCYENAINNGHTEALNNLGILYDKLNNYINAKKCYKKSLKLNDDNALINIGMLYEKFHKYKKANKYYYKAIKKKYNMGHTCLNLLEKRKYDFIASDIENEEIYGSNKKIKYY